MSSSDFYELLHGSRQSRDRLGQAVARLQVSTALGGRAMPRHLLITSSELNDRHGTGVLLSRIFGSHDVFSLVTHLDHQQDGTLPMVHAPDVRFNRHGAVDLLQRIVGLGCNKGVLVVPHFPHEVRLALLLKELANIPLATWIMDDSTLGVDRISRSDMTSLLAVSDVRFAISTELAVDYSKEFGGTFEVLPPTVSRREADVFANVQTQGSSPSRILMLGNMWNEAWVPSISSLLGAAGLQADWYGGDPARRSLAPDAPITPHGFVTEQELAMATARSRFAILPTGSKAIGDATASLTRWSLPSRLVFLVAACRLPVLVVGSATSCAANFVRSAGVGVVCDHTAGDFAAACKEISDPERNVAFRKRCGEIAPHFFSDGLDQWIWKSLETGHALDARFSAILGEKASAIA